MGNPNDKISGSAYSSTESENMFNSWNDIESNNIIDDVVFDSTIQSDLLSDIVRNPDNYTENDVEVAENIMGFRDEYLLNNVADAEDLFDDDFMALVDAGALAHASNFAKANVAMSIEEAIERGDYEDEMDYLNGLIEEVQTPNRPITFI